MKEGTCLLLKHATSSRFLLPLIGDIQQNSLTSYQLKSSFGLQILLLLQIQLECLQL